MNETQAAQEIIRISMCVPKEVATIIASISGHISGVSVRGFIGEWTNRDADFTSYGYYDGSGIGSDTHAVLAELRAWLGEIGYAIPEEKQ